MMPVARLLNARLASTGNSEELLRELRPELVSICTYVGSRSALVEASVRNGAKAIWCEKPLSLTMQEGRLVELCEEKGVKLVINHYRRAQLLSRTLEGSPKSPQIPTGPIQRRAAATRSRTF